jgi:hypothetical protein
MEESKGKCHPFGLEICSFIHNIERDMALSCIGQQLMLQPEMQ